MIDIGNKNGAPNDWINVYDGIYKMRQESGIAYPADVDHIGCANLYDHDLDLKTQRFHILVGLMLSSQTKDPVTAKAVWNLRNNLKNGLTVDSICGISEKNKEIINTEIFSVGFHNRKTDYLMKTARILRDKYDGDIPRSIKDLCSLPGVGPKMAYIAMQVAWNENCGIGVDVHVHRIMNLLKWTRDKKCKSPEHTRKEIESWIPRDLWPGINRLFVGFGQKVCTPRNPKCDICEINQWCPIGKKLLKNSNIKK